MWIPAVVSNFKGIAIIVGNFINIVINNLHNVVSCIPAAY